MAMMYSASMPQEHHDADQSRTKEAAVPTAAGPGDDSQNGSEQGSSDSQRFRAPADDGDPPDHTGGEQGEQPGGQDGGSDSSGGEGSGPDHDAPDLDALASQTLDIWQDYLSASMSDPEAQEMMRSFLAMAVETVRDGTRSAFAPDQHNIWPAAHWMNAFWPASSQNKSQSKNRTGEAGASKSSSCCTDAGSEDTKGNAAQAAQEVHEVQGAHASNHDLASASDERDQNHESNSGKNASSSVGASSHGAASGDRLGADDELAARVAQLERRLRD
ncbi:MAG: hypothetical protein AAF220_12140, partial [Pseudomonadota bacterium]